ncbi:MAG TPA: hypothetical protein PLM07_02385 [Candidatus Rifleibacterium sp.]|nr:hypothetical protein [Candidatus Rifleibacterium sp.]HPT44730.1 hypothetical protein [Candidatus Rifleibacterium sp.]
MPGFGVRNLTLCQILQRVKKNCYTLAMNFKLIAVIALLPYTIWLMIDYQYHFIDGANLLIHEAGHLLFNFIGNHDLTVAGGTILQLFVPLMFAFHLWSGSDRFGAGLCLFWSGESLMYTAVYLGDAQARKLPLWGGGSHDWAYLLAQLGMVKNCQEIALALHLLATVILWAGLFIAFRSAIRPGDSGLIDADSDDLNSEV